MKKKYKIGIICTLTCLMLLISKSTTNRRLVPMFTQNNKIVVVTPSGLKYYFLQKGQVLGYQYEMIKEYAKSMNRQAVFIIESDIDKRLEMIKDQKADIAVCDKSCDSICYDNIYASKFVDIKLSQIFWAVPDKNIKLAININSWLEKFEKTRNQNWLTWRYYDRKTPFVQTKYLSPYDDLIKKYSEKINWDWRLVASIIYQESKFEVGLESHTGASGLMQVRPQTAEYLHMSGNIHDVETNIAVGTKLISFLEHYFQKDSIDAANLTNLVLASYNSGHGKIEICQRYTQSQGYNPNIWENIEYVLSKKYKPKKGTEIIKPSLSGETTRFVREILERYEHYKNFFP